MRRAFRRGKNRFPACSLLASSAPADVTRPTGFRSLPTLAAVALATAVVATRPQAQDAPPPSPAARAAVNRVLAMEVQATDARRFAAVFQSTGGKPSAAQLQAGYLNGAGAGVVAFTPDRIQNATNLAAHVARESERYAYAIATCLPLVDGLRDEMRAVYLAYAGLLPWHKVPDVHVVFGALNSGGTATPEVQVLGLEVMCGPGTTPDAFREAMRRIFAHETVHSFQPASPSLAVYRADPLLYMALAEGTPDFIAMLVTGMQPNAARSAWAAQREPELWLEFSADRKRAIAGLESEWNLNADGRAATMRWIGNYKSAPAGWPDELGYWVGMRIAEAYFARANDKAAALEALITLADPAAILEASGYGKAW